MGSPTRVHRREGLILDWSKIGHDFVDTRSLAMLLEIGFTDDADMVKIP